MPIAVFSSRRTPGRRGPALLVSLARLIPAAAAQLFETPSSYVTEAGTSSGLSDIVFNTGSAAQFATFNNVPSGTDDVRVRVLNGSGESAASDERTIVIP